MKRRVERDIVSAADCSVRFAYGVAEQPRDAPASCPDRGTVPSFALSEAGSWTPCSTPSPWASPALGPLRGEPGLFDGHAAASLVDTEALVFFLPPPAQEQGEPDFAAGIGGR
eukprot:1009087-Alexandrium_andersonii.AAC.1